MKRLLTCLLLSLIIITAGARTVSADLGPKPETDIIFYDLNGRTFYVTLLGEREDEASAHAILEPEYTKGETDEEKAYNAFLEYSLNDEFYFYGWGDLERIDEEHDTYSWNYYPPELFKVAVYDPEEDRLYVSEQVVKEDFYSIYSVSANDPEHVFIDLCLYLDDCTVDPPASDQRSLEKMLQKALTPLVVTVLIETFLGFLFGYRKKQLLVILAANIFTQLILNFLIIVFYYRGGYGTWRPMFALGEIIVILSELLIYLLSIGKDHKVRTIIYTLLANLITASLTLTRIASL